MTQRFVSPLIQILDPITGDPVPNATLTFSETGTATPKDIYSSNAYDTTQPNPITSDTAGRFVDNIFLDTSDGLYRVVCKDSLGNTLWTKDDVGNTSARTDIVGAKTGVITFFVGSQRDLDRQLLAGWKICDGSGGTPNLIGKFTKAQASVTNTGSNGGDSTPLLNATMEEHQLTISEMPQHDHGSPRILNDGSATGWTAMRDSAGATATVPFQYVTNAHGGDQPHNHDMNNQEVDITPKFVYAIPLIFLGT